LVGTDPNALKHYLSLVLQDKWKSGDIPEMWDGNTSERIIETLLEIFER
jgi:UDP-N-acetylglucosamine 2-epimerase (non-hydrolysing)